MSVPSFTAASIAGILVAAALAGGAARAGSPNPTAQALRAEATKLFKQKKLAEACEKFRQAANAAPDDAAVLTDLGLCQHKLGQDKEASVTNLRAIEIASHDPARIEDPSTVRVRRHAYFNLDQANADAVTVITGDDHGTECKTIEPAPGCARSFEVCGFSAGLGARMRTYSRVSAKVALTRADATWTKSEIIQHMNDDPSGNGKATPPPDRPQAADDGKVIFVADFQDEAETAGCEDVSGWTCEKSNAVGEATHVCLKTAGAESASPDVRSMAESACFKRACADLEKHPSKTVAREKRRAQKQVDECSRNLLESVGTHYLCSIVYANACTGLLAVSCSSTGPGDRESSQIDEYRFEPASNGAKP